MTEPKNIAIVAVHGVGNHEPRSSASAISRLLLRIPRPLGGRYTSFSESPIGIPTSLVPEAVTEAELAARQDRVRTKRTRRSLYDERPERSAATADEDVREDPTRPPPDIRFMRDQLRDYEAEPSAAVYETIRIDGRHLAPDDANGAESSAADCRIHVYEMFWSDISRIGPGFLSVFSAFYQVVIHLPYVGLITLEQSRAAAGDHEQLWDSWLAAYRWAMRCMTLVAPTLNILMLAVGLGALTLRIPPGAQRWVALGLPAVIAFAAATWFIYRHRTGRWFVDILLPGLAAAITLAVCWKIDGPFLAGTALVVEWWLIAAIPLWLLFRAFNRNRPFALQLAAVLWVVVSVLLLALEFGRGQNTTAAIVGTLEVLNVLLLITWFVFSFATAAVTAFGLVVPRLGSKDRRDATLRAAYTARFTLALPGVAFAVVTLTIWGALAAAEGGKTFVGDAPYRPLFTYPALEKHKIQDRELAAKRAVTDSIELAKRGMSDSAAAVRRHAVARIDGAAYFLRAFGGSSDGLSGLVGAILIGGALFTVVWILIPVLVTEVSSPSLDINARSAQGFSERARKLGTWLSTAFRTGRLSGETLVVATIASMAGIIIAVPIPIPQWLDRLTSVVPPLRFGFMEVGGWVIGAGAIGLVALFTRFSTAGSRLRPVFGIMADVDNYLRELPRERTPRARMAERYTSLLRYLCRWRADGAPSKGYDAIIVVAHSQGTVITADLLRYLKHYKAGGGAFEPHLAPLAGASPALPIYLLTMGSPLRQLYGQRFPDIYSWVGGSSDPVPTPARPETSTLLGVKAWINLYRSGDYVGRSLWRTPDQLADIYDPRVPEIERGEHRAEVCVGAGAHTHYWDESAQSVALAIDSVVRDVVKSTPAVMMIDRVIDAASAPPGLTARVNQPIAEVLKTRQRIVDVILIRSTGIGGGLLRLGQRIWTRQRADFTHVQIYVDGDIVMDSMPRQGVMHRNIIKEVRSGRLTSAMCDDGRAIVLRAASLDVDIAALSSEMLSGFVGCTMAQIGKRYNTAFGLRDGAKPWFIPGADRAVFCSQLAAIILASASVLPTSWKVPELIFPVHFQSLIRAPGWRDVTDDWREALDGLEGLLRSKDPDDGLMLAEREDAADQAITSTLWNRRTMDNALAVTRMATEMGAQVTKITEQFRDTARKK